MHGTIGTTFVVHGLLAPVRRFFSELAEFAHAILLLPVWRYALTFVSAYTTCRGLMLLYNVFGADSGTSAGALNILIPIALAGAVHSAIFWGLTNWAHTRRSSFLGIVLVLQLVAILTSYGCHWITMRGGDFTAGLYLTAQTGTERGIRTFTESYSAVGEQMEALAKEASQKAGLEASTGTSCGTEAGDGKGPRYDLRMADQATFSSLNSDLISRRKRLEQLVERVDKLAAGSADDAVAKLPELRRVVNEVKSSFESDPIIEQIRKIAEARIQKGRAPIEIPPAKRGKSGQTHMSCFDAELERRLEGVLTAIRNLKPLAEVVVPDAREPHVGFALALQRLLRRIGGIDLSVPTREALKQDRVRTLANQSNAADDMLWQNLSPLFIAVSIELLLTLLFRLTGGGVQQHPGLGSLRNFLSQPNENVFAKVWSALGGGTDPLALRRLLNKHAKFARRKVWIFVPLYADEPDYWALHSLMELLVEFRLAKPVFAGTGLVLRTLYMTGWERSRTARIAGYGAARVYTMSASEYLVFTLDASRSSPPSPLQPLPYAAHAIEPSGVL